MQSSFLINIGCKSFIDNATEKIIDEVFLVGNKLNIKIDNYDSIDKIFEYLKLDMLKTELNLPLQYNKELIQTNLILMNNILFRQINKVFKFYLKQDILESQDLLNLNKQEKFIIEYIRKIDEKYHLVQSSTNVTTNSSESTIYYTTLQCLSSQSIPEIKEKQLKQINKNHNKNHKSMF